MEERDVFDLRAVFFDMDNTLIATRRADAETCDQLTNILHQKYSVPLDVASRICRKFLVSFRKCPDPGNQDLDVWRTFLWEQALGSDYKVLKGPIYQQWLQLRLERLAPPPDTKRLLRTLRKNYLVALITNGPSRPQWEKINRLNLSGYFDLVLVSGDLPWEKPHQRIFHEACDSLRVHPQSCIVVGDKLETDILGGIRAKLGATVWVPLESKELGSDDPVPDFIIDDVLDLKMNIPKIRKVMKCRGKCLSLTFDISISDVEDCNSNSSHGSS